MSDADYLLASSALAAVKKLVAASGSRYQVFTRLPAASSVFFRDSDDTQHAYNALVPLPLSLGEIASRVKAKHYRSLQAAKHDMWVICSNAALFHGAGSRYAEDAATLSRTFHAALDRAPAGAGGGGGGGQGEGSLPGNDHDLLGVSVPRGHLAARPRPPLSPPPASVPAALNLTARHTAASPAAQRLRLRLPGYRPRDTTSTAARPGTKLHQSDSNGGEDEQVGDDSAGDDAPKVRTSKRVASAGGGRQRHSHCDDAGSGDGGSSDDSDDMDKSKKAGHGRRSANRAGRRGSAVISEDDSGGGESSSEDHSDRGRRGGRRSHGTVSNRRGGDGGQQREHSTRGRTSRTTTWGGSWWGEEGPLKIKIKQGLDLNLAGTAPSTAAAQPAAARPVGIGATLSDNDHSTGPASLQQPRPTRSTTAATDVANTHRTGFSHPHQAAIASGLSQQGTQPHDEASHGTGHEPPPTSQHVGATGSGGTAGGGGGSALSASRPTSLRLGSLSRAGKRERGTSVGQDLHRPMHTRAPVVATGAPQRGGSLGPVTHGVLPLMVMSRSVAGELPGLGPLGGRLSVSDGDAGGVQQQSGSDYEPTSITAVLGALPVSNPRQQTTRRSNTQQQQQQQQQDHHQQQEQQQQQQTSQCATLPEEAASDNPGWGMHGTAGSGNAKAGRRHASVPWGEDNTPYQSVMGEGQSGREADDGDPHGAVADSGQVVSRSGRVSKPRVVKD
ncbi:MAG: hypothetical protein WDW38_006902 [Sanguina aurantia]